jgi:hypothetical protein
VLDNFDRLGNPPDQITAAHDSGTILQRRLAEDCSNVYTVDIAIHI